MNEKHLMAMTIDAHRVENLFESLLISLVKVIIIAKKNKLKANTHAGEFSVSYR